MKKKKIRICDITYITKNTVVSVLVVVLLTGLISITAVAETGNRAANIKSKGIFEYQNYTAVFDASDLVYLADEIDLLEDTYKEETVEALNQIGTYYRIDGTATHDAEENTLPLENANMLDFSVIKSGIINSQSIPSDRTYSGSIPGSDDVITGNISAATAENLSLGSAAWVDGALIVGTGADNNSYYAEGYTEGKHESNSIIKLGGYGTYDLTQYDNYTDFAINKNIFITLNSVTVNAKLSVRDAAGALHFSASNAGQPYTATYSNGILNVTARDISCSTTVSDVYEDVGTISGNVSANVAVYLLLE